LANVSRKYRNGAFVAFRSSWNPIAAPATKLCLFPSTPIARRILWRLSPVSCLTQLSWPLGADQLVYLVLSRRWLLTEEANNRIYRIQIIIVLLQSLSRASSNVVLNCFAIRQIHLSSRFPRLSSDSALGRSSVTPENRIWRTGVNRIAEMALASQLEEVERLEVQLKTDLSQLAHGEVDSIAINLNGLVIASWPWKNCYRLIGSL